MVRLNILKGRKNFGWVFCPCDIGQKQLGYKVQFLSNQTKISRSISMVIYGKFFEKGFISESKFSNESTPTG